MPTENWELHRRRNNKIADRLDREWHAGNTPTIHPLRGDVDADVRDFLRREEEIMYGGISRCKESRI